MAPVGHRRLVALVILLALVGAPLAPTGLGAAPTDVGGAIGAGVGDALQDALGQSSVEAESPSGPTLGPPDWPARPLHPDRVDGRWAVQNASEPPNSAIGHLGATGVLVSDYHVLTAAHVVTDDRGRVEPLEEIVFTPGLRAPPDGPATVPYGRAAVREVHVHPEWEGRPPEQDLALLELDRPVGVHAGTMRLAPAAASRPGDHDLRQAGYVNNVTGHRQIASSPRLEHLRSRAHSGYLHYCAPLSHGDSGSPIWTSVDDRPTVLAVNSDWASRERCDDAAVGVSMTADRVERVRQWMADDRRPRSKADLVVATPHAGPTWVPPANAMPDGPVSLDADDTGDADGESDDPWSDVLGDAGAASGDDSETQSGDGAAGVDDEPSDAVEFAVGTRVYNNGPLAVGTGVGGSSSVRIADYVATPRATVAFHASLRRPTHEGTRTVVDDLPLCRDRISIDAYATETARCSVSELPRAVEPGDVLAVYATVDPDDRVPEYDASPLPDADGEQPVGRIRIAGS